MRGFPPDRLDLDASHFQVKNVAIAKKALTIQNIWGA
jgi:hypothetical protein